MSTVAQGKNDGAVVDSSGSARNGGDDDGEWLVMMKSSIRPVHSSPSASHLLLSHSSLQKAVLCSAIVLLRLKILEDLRVNC